jgi:CubicO group peptidase (beta-lactamase class C family)
MRLVDTEKVNIHHTLGHYLPAIEKTNKAPLRVDQVMGHHAGLISWIPFYRETMTRSKYPRPSPQIYSNERQGKYTVPVTDKLFMSEDYISSIWDQLGESEVRPQGRYRYSDLGFYILTEVVRQQAGMRLDSFARADFYGPLGLGQTGFNPSAWYPKEHIVPTEEDHYFRMQRVQGYVHDMGSAMLGGVAGHAGLFTSAGDLAVLMQMLLNNGYYGGKRYLSPEVIHTFTRRIEGSTRRAIGFDMKELNPDRRTFTSELASDFTYGHTGFTGIGVWNDPVHELTYIFLSNRTYPNSRNNKLSKERIRERIHDLVYRSFIYSDRSTTFP